MSELSNALNFSGGPGVLPESVLNEAQEAIRSVPEVGLSVLGISHRSDWFAAVVEEVERNIRQLLQLPDSHALLLLQGGATLQFSLVPMLLLRDSGKTAEYIHSGYWSRQSIPPARLEGEVRVLWDGEASGFRRLPAASELLHRADAAYFHYVSNETVEGIQFHQIPGREDVPRVCDMSSDFLSRPFDPDRFDLIYAHAQKNLGPAGVTIVIVRRDLLDQVPDGIPAVLDYRAHIKAHSIYNTPPVFAIYVVLLVTRWLIEDIGGLERMATINQHKADALYAIIDSHTDLYRGWARPENRSLMNVTFELPSTDHETAFLNQARVMGFSGLKGHRSLGGIRASIYNAMRLDAVESLCAFMEDFATQARR